VEIYRDKEEKRRDPVPEGPIPTPKEAEESTFTE
jgi:hypothetical protein